MSLDMIPVMVAEQSNEPYFHPTRLGPDCSTPRSARLREHRVRMGYEKRTEPPEYTRLAEEVKQVYLEFEKVDPALARAKALYYVVEHCEIKIDDDSLLVGGEVPFFYNLMLPALSADHFSVVRDQAFGETGQQLRAGGVFSGPCFDGHITPGLEYILAQGISGIRKRVEEYRRLSLAAGKVDKETEYFYEAARLSCDAVSLYSRRYQQELDRLSQIEPDAARAEKLRQAAQILRRVPEHPATTLREALQAYWLVYILVTLEMGGANPGGGLGLGRPDQYLYPYYARDLHQGRLDRAQAMELMEHFLLSFCHVDYYTPHQVYTTGSQACLGGVTPTGSDAFNELTELILEASLRIDMPTPYISLRLYRQAPERFWQVAANYITSGLGFPVVNDEVLIPAMLRHERSLGDARDYICSCCYEHTIPGREAFHPSCIFINLPMLLELALHQGRSLLKGEQVGPVTSTAGEGMTFEDLLAVFRQQIKYAIERIVTATNQADQAHCTYRRYPLMSLFIDDCLAKSKDVCSGGARYNLTGCVVGGLPNVVNSLAAIRQLVFETKTISMEDLLAALKDNFVGYEKIRQQLLAAPKWGNDDRRVDDMAGTINEWLYTELAPHRNARGGRWQLALYTFVANHWMGEVLGASADGRPARQILTRNMNPTWGTDRLGPTAVLNSLSRIDFTTSPDGSSLDLRFDPAMFQSAELRRTFIGFLKAFVELGVMEMQISVADTESLLDAQTHPERYPHLMVRVAGYSARFVDLARQEQDEIIGRSMQRY
jgi:pyruvate formate-lyase/glycerol dehydratase family glycyl radical enzyme